MGLMGRGGWIGVLRAVILAGGLAAAANASSVTYQFANEAMVFTVPDFLPHIPSPVADSWGFTPAQMTACAGAIGNPNCSSGTVQLSYDELGVPSAFFQINVELPHTFGMKVDWFHATFPGVDLLHTGTFRSTGGAPLVISLSDAPPTAAPEPGSLAFIGGGVLLLGGIARRKLRYPNKEVA
jgi:hypothetical protein